MFLNQKLVVRWNGEFSQHFSVSNGVKARRDNLAYIILCVYIYIYIYIYIYELLNELKKSGSGCYIGFNFYGALGYADDNSLESFYLWYAKDA